MQNPLTWLKERFTRNAPPPKPSLREALGNIETLTPERPKKNVAPIEVADGVDLSALWEEPGDPSSMAMILAGVAAFLAAIAALGAWIH